MTMGIREKRGLEERVRKHYRLLDEQLCADGPETAPPTLLALLTAEARRPHRPGVASVVRTQARCVGPLCWALHAGVPLLAAALRLSGPHAASAACALGAACALASLAELTRSRSCGMAELEAACAVNAQAAGCAKLVLLGCADALLVLVTSALVAPVAGLWTTLARMGATYLLAAAGGLLAARRAPSTDATAVATALAALVCAASLTLRLVVPQAFDEAAAIVWWLAAVAAGALAALEARAWLRDAESAFTAADRACITLFQE